MDISTESKQPASPPPIEVVEAEPIEPEEVEIDFDARHMVEDLPAFQEYQRELRQELY